MIEELAAIHEQVISLTPTDIERYLSKMVNWEANAICLLGSRGVGKTTLMSQQLIKRYKNVAEGLYISADNVHVLSHGLFTIAQEYFKFGGRALFIDEVHKYPGWSGELKNIVDTYKDRQVVFSGSSSLELRKSKHDLSRRAVYYELKDLSFREYLKCSEGFEFPALTLEEIIYKHVELADQFKNMTILKHFNEYLMHGCYPFFMEGVEDYLSKLTNVIEKVLFEDIAVVNNLRQPTVIVLKKLLWLVATSSGFVPNIDRISNALRVSREIIYNCLEYLAQAGLLNNLRSDARGMKLVRKPGKIFLENTNLLHAINGTLKLESDTGNIRETFFADQVSHSHRLTLHDHGDFVVDGKFVFEVGGKTKDSRQIKSINDSYLVIDNIEIGFGNKIPLYLFGFLY